MAKKANKKVAEKKLKEAKQTKQTPKKRTTFQKLDSTTYLGDFVRRWTNDGNEMGSPLDKGHPATLKDIRDELELNLDELNSTLEELDEIEEEFGAECPLKDLT